MKFRKEHFKHKLEKGKNAGKTFPLIGLPVVIAIRAILAGTLLPALSAARERAKTLTCMNNQKQTAMETQNHISLMLHGKVADFAFPDEHAGTVFHNNFAQTFKLLNADNKVLYYNTNRSAISIENKVTI